MPSPKGKAGAFAGAFIADQVKRLAADPEVHKAVIHGAAPVIGGVGAAAKKVAAKAKLPKKADPFDTLNDGLDVIAAMATDQRPGDIPEATLADWKQRLAAQRRAIPLARIDEGKSRKQKLKDLTERQHKLLDDIYAATIESHGAGADDNA